ncbi:hypothetical protein, partial [Burkholderia pseudomallei]|uniref:hypothetical protein n=1 Tax=Burkholderia pseudomallei TaxID=28450 RepID=UPI0021F78EA6
SYARAECEAPQGAQEEALAAVWRQLRQLECVGRDDNSLAARGHRLLPVQRVSRLRQPLSACAALSPLLCALVPSAPAARSDAAQTRAPPRAMALPGRG